MGVSKVLPMTLTAHLTHLRTTLALPVPAPDPLDGGAAARVLLLLEKPGPASARLGLITRDGPNPTARAIKAFAERAGLPREATIIWNVIPAWNGTIRVSAAELRGGLAHLPAFLDCLPSLRGAILVGRRAQSAAPLIEARGLPWVASAHPSPQVRAARRADWEAIPARWAAAKAWL